MKGTYLLFIRINSDKRFCVGSLGVIDFKKGLYVYVGSGMNNMLKRVARHFRRDKKMRWHIDYLSVNSDDMLAFLIPNERMECRIAGDLSKRFEYVKGFGCSDCKCKSHLFYLGDL